MFLKSFKTDIKDILPFHGNIEDTGKRFTIRITGYIHPLNAPLVEGTHALGLYLRGSGGLTVTLNLSKDSSVKNQEIVIPRSKYNLPSSTQQARREKGGMIFPHTARGHKYYVSVVADQILDNNKASLSLEWNIDVTESTSLMKESLNLITMEFLEPYNSIHCTIHNNCLACMTDASCAWCTSSSVCLYKGDNATRCEGTYAVTQPEQCNLCHDHPDCHSCVSVSIIFYGPCYWTIRLYPMSEFV